MPIYLKILSVNWIYLSLLALRNWGKYTFRMSSYEENRNFEVTLRLAFFLFREALVYAVKKLLEFKICKIIFVATSVFEIISQEKEKNKPLSPRFLELCQYVYNSAHILPSRGRNFNKSVRVFQKCAVFLRSPPKKWNSNPFIQVVTGQDKDFSSHCDWEK